jgi:prepilin-type N-terminal cleavage/methylation domain-containing protein
MFNNRKTQSGFSLLETIVAVTVAGMVLGVLVQTFLQSAYTQKQLAGRVTAVVLGSGKLAELAAQAETSTSGIFPAPYQRYRWSCRTVTADNGVAKRELVVEWSGTNGSSQRKSLQQYRLAQ